MKIGICFFCDQLKYVPYHVTEINPNKSVDSVVMCSECGAQYINDIAPKGSSGSDMKMSKSNENGVDDIINSIEELKDFIFGTSMHQPVQSEKVCKCGWTEKDFNKCGRMGCPECYNCFTNQMKSVVYPYHGSSSHCGKSPKKKALVTPEDKLKLLKLQYAKALELEEYEKLRDLKRQIDELS